MSPSASQPTDPLVAVVTGAASGIGRASAAALSRLGAAVALLDLDDDGLADLAAQLPGPAMALRCDVSDERSVQEAVGSVRDALGPVTVLHNNAGICLNGDGPDDDGPPHSITASAWDRTLAVNLTGCFLLAKHVLPGMLAAGRGSVINTASVGGNFYGTRHVAYAASKAGVAGLTRSMAVEYGPRGIRTNAVCPGPVETPMSAMARAVGPELEQWLQSVPLRRIGQPAEISEVVSFLASDASSFVNGAVFVVDGGMTVA